MHEVKNPILTGFNPDPSILRVGQDYYIATSTFEWFPGVCIHHSRDLKNWSLVAQPLNRGSQLDMRGNPDSCGVWAPCLSYHHGTFYLCFTDTKRFSGDFKDTHNYIVTTDDILGDWSEPHYINSSGFDPSLFFDNDGSAWFLNMIWDHRPKHGRNNWSPDGYFGGTILQQLDIKTMQLKGEAKNIYPGSALGLSEGPHLYRRGQWYYLLLAEGGTGKDHACTFVRSHSIEGPYIEDPNGPIITSACSPLNPIKRAGHGDWVETPDGDYYLVHLCSRPLPYRGRSVMGRETAIQQIEWDKDDWPRLKSGLNQPSSSCSVNTAIKTGNLLIDQMVDFSTNKIPKDFQTLRMALPESTLSLSANPQKLRLYGKESLGSLFHQSLLARRQQAFCFVAETQLDFSPNTYQQMAGLTCYYNSKKYYYLHITVDDEHNRILDLSMCINSDHSKYPLPNPIILPKEGDITLKASINHDLLNFSYSLDGQEWTDVPCSLDYSVLCDELGDNGADANFTGAFVGICCQDLSGSSLHADFSYFHYIEKP